MSGWIEWSGGPCPVPLESWVDVKLRGDKKPWCETYGYPELASAFAGLMGEEETPSTSNWMHDGGNLDITAYRLVAAPLPEARP